MDSSQRDWIEALLPHRPPFLFLDRIIEQGDDWILTEWDVPEELEVFEGHFPGDPVLPGVLISEHCFQSGALLIYSGTESKEDPGIPVLSKIEDARFKRIVRPGSTLRTRVTLVEQLSNARWCEAKVACDEKPVARLKFVLALAPREVVT